MISCAGTISSGAENYCYDYISMAYAGNIKIQKVEKI